MLTKTSAGRWPHRSDLAFDAGRGDVAERARVEKRSIEDTARVARYEFLAGSRAPARRQRRSPSATRSTIRRRRFCFG